MNLNGTSISGRVWESLSRSQQEDGGWVDVPSTIWSLRAMGALGARGEVWSKGIAWLLSVRKACGAWGRTERDIPRIPVTGLCLHLFPELGSKEGYEWFATTWRQDLESEVHLTYKGAFTLLGLKGKEEFAPGSLISDTIDYLAQEQNEDGGFGPWKDHPIGSDPWSTGIVLWGLSEYADRVDPRVLERGLAWLAQNQLDNGFWRYHYLDEGASYALIGAVKAATALKGRP
jgi:hypothetical protein